MNDIGMILQSVAKKMAGEVAPKLEGDYAAGHVRIASVLMAMAGESWDGGVDRLHNEIESMRELLQKAGKEPAGGQPRSFKITDLRKVHDCLSSQIIDLQVQLEESDKREAQELNTKIWQFFLVSALGRMPSLPSFE